MPNNKERTVIITGAAGNLGSSVAQKFLEGSANLVLTDRGVGRLDQHFPELSDSDQHILADGIDVTNLNSINKLIENVLDLFKQIDVLVNTIGGYRAGTTLPNTPVDTLDSMFTLNTRSVYIASQAVLPHMIEQKRGKIISVAARAGLRGRAKMSAYSVSKSAVIRLTESMAAEVKNVGINVNCILPGTIDTPQNRAAMPDANYALWVKPESLANVIYFLASEEARDIHGASIPVYGNS
jgi:NAD(P)-dependent dehydrogenase (short-subunit alcohol dehydrogenase family)